MSDDTLQALRALRTSYQSDKSALFDGLGLGGLAARKALLALRALARRTDTLLRDLWRLAGLDEALALVAVGGYGRGELFPQSDVDVMVLCPETNAPSAAQEAAIARFVGLCWDAGLEIGSSVRSPAQCVSEAQADVTVQTALLEARRILGPHALFAAMQSRTQAVIDAPAFFLAKTLEMQQRHGKFEDSPYALEPNCKESPGGLRDLQVVLWVAQAAGLGHDWAGLVRAGMMSPLEARAVRRNEALLKLIRTRLHLLARRREDRLVFDLQASVAQSFGFKPPDPSQDPRAFVRPSEALMRHYYWAAKAVTQLRQILLLNIEERLNPQNHTLRALNDRFFDKAGMVEVASDDLYQRQPHAILETFLVFQGDPSLKGLSARTLRALYHARGHMNAAFRRDPVNHDTFKRILMQPRGITHAMRLMNQTSVLGRYLWPFRRIVGQMQHDLFHVYTVDQHTLMVLRNLRRFFLAEHAHEYPFCSQLAADIDQPWILFVAALFHDIAKGRGGDHSVLGEIEAKRFCRAHGIAAEPARLIALLVRQHLSMSQVAQKSDLSDPEVIRAFAHKVGDEHALTLLYLFTVADIRGTSPKVWNGWKGKLLEDLYRGACQVLGGHSADVHAQVRERQRQALIELALHSEPFESHKPLWATLDVGYFMRHDAGEIAWHTRRLARHLRSPSPIVRARASSTGEGLQVLVYTPDQPDLFARICGYFDHSDFSILDARIYTTLSGYALDTFEVTPAQPEGHQREWITMVESELTRTLNIGGELPEPHRGRVSRRVKSFPIQPRVSLRPDERGQRWLLNISCSDRVGLLYSVARVLARHTIDLQLARVTTLGERVEDTFVISGTALQHNREQIAIETELIEALA